MDRQKHGEEGGGRRGWNSHGTCLLRTRAKLKEERQRDSTEEGQWLALWWPGHLTSTAELSLM